MFAVTPINSSLLLVVVAVLVESRAVADACPCLAVLSNELLVASPETSKINRLESLKPVVTVTVSAAAFELKACQTFILKPLVLVIVATRFQVLP